MVSYLVATIPWTVGCLALSPMNRQAIKYRKFFAGCFFGSLIPSLYFFIQHKVHKVAGGMNSCSSALDIPSNFNSVHNLRIFRVGPRSI